jgi:NADPH-dependent curcumin reductase CurA
MGGWVKAGKVHYREEMIEGLEQAPAAIVGLLKGDAFGKRVVKLTA